MSAVEDVEARLCRLHEAFQVKKTQLLELSTQRVYNPTVGVDQDHFGRSVASLELSVVAARNVEFHAGFLAGKTTYVRAYLEPTEAARDTERKCTQKQPISPTPSWQETLVIHGVQMVHATVVLEIMQEERFGADQVLGVVRMDLGSLHDQRVNERWHPVTRDQQATQTLLLLSCRLNRSLIFALELECELLQNQIKELEDFVQRQQRVSSFSFGGVRSASGRLLEGKEVQHPRLGSRTPPRRFDHASSRMDAMHSPIALPCGARKRERRVSSAGGSGITISPIEGNVNPFATGEEPRLKRRKLEKVTETHVDSLSSRLANWLLPTPPNPTILPPVHPPMHPPMHPPVHPHSSPINPVHHRRPPPRRSTKPKKKSSALFALEQWLFQDSAQGPTPPSVELVHAQMRAES